MIIEITEHRIIISWPLNFAITVIVNAKNSIELKKAKAPDSYPMYCKKSRINATFMIAEIMDTLATEKVFFSATSE